MVLLLTRELSSSPIVGTSIIAKKVLDKSFYPSDTAQWSEWADKKLAVMLYPNITRSMEESWECFQVYPPPPPSHSIPPSQPHRTHSFTQSLTYYHLPSYPVYQYTDNVMTWNAPMRYTTKVAGAIAMSFANGKIKKKYGTTFIPLLTHPHSLTLFYTPLVPLLGHSVT